MTTCVHNFVIVDLVVALKNKSKLIFDLVSTVRRFEYKERL